MKSNPFRDLTRFERTLWLLSAAAVIASFLLSGGADWLSMISSLIGVTALIFIAKGYIFGQLLSLAFAVFYGVISYFLRYYGEMITYLCMTLPVNVMAVVSWLRHPYQDSKEVEVHRITRRQGVLLAFATATVTVAFYFILGALGNASLVVSTFSVATSFLASSLTYFRSPYYALAYAANDVVLIILWGIAAAGAVSYLPMVVCFVMFLANDLYAFINWRRMQRRQSGN